jgi:hypothetical protein
MEFDSDLFLVKETNIYQKKILSDIEIYQR